jgi:predicted ATP-binding protein involved in virulence
MSAKRSPYVYFARLKLTNVKSFGATEERLDLTDSSGKPAKWTLLLGDNGVGKTTLLQCIALMRPVLSNKRTATNAAEPDRVQAALASRENADIAVLARVGSARVKLEAEMISGRRLSGVGGKPTTLKTTVDIHMREDKLNNFKAPLVKVPGFTEPLVIGYSAARHMSYGRGDTEPAFEDPAESLFDPSIELADAEEILQRLDYAAAKSNVRAKALLQRVKEALARLLPDVKDESAIAIYGPPTPGFEGSKTGVQVRTHYGEVPLSSLSLGYQTTTAWAVDLAWKLFQRYPESKDPLREPAVVLIDEIDLHLHPLWQRQFRPMVSEFFPEVQFIATAHSPLMVQSYLDSNVVVLTRRGDHVEIENDPAIVRNWGLDEVVTSDLFGLASAYPPEIDAMIGERARLLALKTRTTGEKRRLLELQEAIEALTDEAEEQASPRATRSVHNPAR